MPSKQLWMFKVPLEPFLAATQTWGYPQASWFWWHSPGTATPYTLTSWMKSTKPSVASTSVVATFSPFQLGRRRDRAAAGQDLGCPPAQTRAGASGLPESVADAVLEVDEVLVVPHEEVTAVEEGVSSGQDVPQDLLLCLLRVAGVAVEGRVGGDFDHQQPRLAFREGWEVWRSPKPCLGSFPGVSGGFQPPTGGGGQG